ncbi:chemotaxis protein CheW [Pantanalinema rosaneae CENA516]|uniref:chemotaxis protein CheW n=1 Tax=Pantanalinema rosaneae TaxID=1620701 RepID=UPI003D6F1762
MLLLLVHVGEERLALDSRYIVEITPLVALKKLAHAPSYLAGMFNYRGQIVPVIDLGELIRGQPCTTHLSTRIIVVRPMGDRQDPQPLAVTTETSNPVSPPLFGLIAERVTETFSWSASTLVEPPLHSQAAAYLGDLIIDPQGMIQCLEIEPLLPYIQAVPLLPPFKA